MRRRLFGLATAAVLATGAGALAALGAAGPAGAGTAGVGRNVLEARMLAAARALVSDGTPSPAAQKRTRLLGAVGLGPLNGDVWSHGDVAYVGTWSGPCPGTGVKIVDVSDPRSPTQVATAAGYPNTSAEDMQVATVHTAAFTGDLMAVGLQDCGLPDEDPGRTGVDLWDVTDPAAPAHLGFYDTGTGGTHEVSLSVRTIAGVQRVFALAAVPFSEPFSTLFGDHPVGDFQLVEVTDPRSPFLSDDWGAGKDGGLPFGAPFLADLGAPVDCSTPPTDPPTCRGAFPAVFDHSTSPSADGRTAYLAYWDLGAISLDMTDPTNLRMIGRTPYPPDSEGDTHSAVPSADGRLLATTDEDFSPADVGPVAGDTWGFARLWDVSDPAAPAHLSDVTTPHSLTNKRNGFYSAHNPEFVDPTTLSVSWYSDGVRFFDVSDPRHPVETAFYRPGKNVDASGTFGSQPAVIVWGAHTEGATTYLSDMNYGLVVVQRT